MTNRRPGRQPDRRVAGREPDGVPGAAARAWPGWPAIGHGRGAYRFAGRDGVQLACRKTGSGRPLVLLHGFTGAGPRMLSDGRAGGLAGQGCRLLVPGFRGHGDSATLHDPAACPPDVLAGGGLALAGHLGLGDGDDGLGGYSPGGRIAVRMLVRGARPGRAVVAGQGLAKGERPAARRGEPPRADRARRPGRDRARLARRADRAPDLAARRRSRGVAAGADLACSRPLRTRCATSRFRRSPRSARRMSAVMPASWPRCCAMPGSSACRAIMAAPAPRPSSPPRSPRSSPDADAGAERRGPGPARRRSFPSWRRACPRGAAGLRARTSDRTGQAPGSMAYLAASPQQAAWHRKPPDASPNARASSAPVPPICTAGWWPRSPPDAAPNRAICVRQRALSDSRPTSGSPDERALSGKPIGRSRASTRRMIPRILRHRCLSPWARPRRASP